MCQTSAHDLKVNNQDQIIEALGADNRYFANIHYGRKATDSECVLYYIDHGGATGHRQRMLEHESKD